MPGTVYPQPATLVIIAALIDDRIGPDLMKPFDPGRFAQQGSFLVMTPKQPGKLNPSSLAEYVKFLIDIVDQACALHSSFADMSDI